MNALLRYLLIACTAWLAMPAVADDCLVIAHRGASAYLPEHTLAAYELAIEQGADVIEPDVVLTKDGVPIARHENILGLTTDVALWAEFADRRRVATIGSNDYDDWFTEDFTLEEIRSLHAIERYPELRPDSAARDGEFPVPTLQEVIDFLFAERERTGRPIGLYPEIKQPEDFAGRGLDSVQIILDTLARNGLDSPDDRVWVQSFDAAALRRANQLTELPLVQLVGGSDAEKIAAQTSPEFLAEVATYADGIGVPKYGYVLRGTDGIADPSFLPTELVANAHAAGLFVHVYTFRAENKYLPQDLQRMDVLHGNLAAEIRLFLEAGIDGFFTDFPDIGRAACDDYAASAQP